MESIFESHYTCKCEMIIHRYNGRGQCHINFQLGRGAIVAVSNIRKMSSHYTMILFVPLASFSNKFWLREILRKIPVRVEGICVLEAFLSKYGTSLVVLF